MASTAQLTTFSQQTPTWLTSGLVGARKTALFPAALSAGRLRRMASPAMRVLPLPARRGYNGFGFHWIITHVHSCVTAAQLLHCVRNGIVQLRCSSRPRAVPVSRVTRVLRRRAVRIRSSWYDRGTRGGAAAAPLPPPAAPGSALGPAARPREAGGAADVALPVLGGGSAAPELGSPGPASAPFCRAASSAGACRHQAHVGRSAAAAAAAACRRGRTVVSCAQTGGQDPCGWKLCGSSTSCVFSLERRKAEDQARLILLAHNLGPSMRTIAGFSGINRKL